MPAPTLGIGWIILTFLGKPNFIAGTVSVGQ